ncbi:hypothetical protein BFINE_44830 [Bacteroides finegoldii DSM 17565]|nr:hypothetical protein BFINE_44830 [Bacteroides finegoldii DSM 17565]
MSSLLAYGDKRAMLDRLITETEKDMQAVREIMERNDRKALDEWIHRQRSSWAVIRADKPCGTCMNCCIKNLNVPKWNCGNAWMPCFVWEQLS